MARAGRAVALKHVLATDFVHILITEIFSRSDGCEYATHRPSGASATSQLLCPMALRHSRQGLPPKCIKQVRSST
jgi:hypothetical protein